MRRCPRATAASGVIFAALACTEPPRLTGPEAATLPVPVAASATGSVPDCGFEGGGACAALEIGARCDVGLQVDQRGTPLQPLDDRCVNDTRHLVGAGFRGSWADWALANQRTLAVDEPLNWVQLISTHNADNNIADRAAYQGIAQSLDPNQVWSMSDQLDVGSRMLWLDLHWKLLAVRLCHGGGGWAHFGCRGGSRRFAYAVREIADWMAANPGEIVVLDLEAYVEEHFADVSEPLKTFFGSKLYATDDRTDVSAPWPSRRELLASGKQVIVGALGGSNPAYYVGDNFDRTTHDGYIYHDVQTRYIKHFEAERTAGIVTNCTTLYTDFGRQTLLLTNRQFRVVGEDRTTWSLTRGVDHHHHVGVIHPSDAADLAGCGVFLVSLDMISASRGDLARRWIPDLLERDDRVPDEELQPYFVWSWRSGDRGGAGDAALLRGSDGRWSSEPPSQAHRFACGRPRSETSRDIADWTDPLGTEWRVTTRTGEWREGGRACLDEYGDEGFVFSVPVNGFANGQLRLADAPRGDLWLNYNDIKQEGSWLVNQRPAARAGADRTIECDGHAGTPVRLDGGASSDADGDGLSYEWSGTFGTATGAQPTVLLPVGRHVITLLTDDGFGGVDVDEVVIEVVDTTPPEIRSAIASPGELWPPNHKMARVEFTVDVHDACDAAPLCRIVSIASDEPVNDVGDGDTERDWEITGALTANLRAERAGTGDGRIYTITIECTDHSGNSSRTDVLVPVPHDRS